MNFVHLRIFGDELDIDAVRSNLMLAPDVVSIPDENTNLRKTSWTYTEEAETDRLKCVVDSLIVRLYDKKDFIKELSEKGNEIYLVIAYYVESYQGIISVDSSLLSMLGEMNIELVVDIMAP